MEDQLGRLVQRTMTDQDFAQRALRDLDGTLAAEGFLLSGEEMEAVREFHAQFAGQPADRVRADLADALAGAARRQAGG